MKVFRKAKLQVDSGEFGWELSLVEGDVEILDELYGMKKGYENMTRDERGFMVNEPIEKAMEHVLDVAKGMKMTAEETGTNFMTLSKTYLPDPIEFEVDLKWGLWDTDESIWEDCEGESGKEIYQKMREAFKGEGAPVTIQTAPRKEIRFGTVDIYEGGASVKFHTHWDSPWDLLPDCLPDDEEVQEDFKNLIEDYLQDSYGYCEGDVNDPIGAEISDDIKAGTFEELMGKIDELESELLDLESQHSTEFHQFLDVFTKQFKKDNQQKTENSEEYTPHDWLGGWVNEFTLPMLLGKFGFEVEGISLNEQSLYIELMELSKIKDDYVVTDISKNLKRNGYHNFAVWRNIEFIPGKPFITEVWLCCDEKEVRKILRFCTKEN